MEVIRLNGKDLAAQIRLSLHNKEALETAPDDAVCGIKELMSKAEENASG